MISGGNPGSKGPGKVSEGLFPPSSLQEGTLSSISLETGPSPGRGALLAPRPRRPPAPWLLPGRREGGAGFRAPLALTEASPWPSRNQPPEPARVLSGVLCGERAGARGHGAARRAAEARERGERAGTRGHGAARRAPEARERGEGAPAPGRRPPGCTRSRGAEPSGSRARR